MLPNTSLIWFRNDLRLADNPALTAAAASGRVIALYVLDDTAGRPIGAASRWWLHHALLALRHDLARYHIPLLVKRGAALQLIPSLLEGLGIGCIYWNRLYEPALIARDTELKAALKAAGKQVQSFPASLLVEPWQVKNKEGSFFRVFTPFARHVLAGLPSMHPLPVPDLTHAASPRPADLADDALNLLPTAPDWSAPLAASWAIGEAAAHTQLHRFLAEGLGDYAQGRDRPDQANTSRLSPYLHFGHISPRQVLHAAQALPQAVSLQKHLEKFVAELLWREFSYHLLYHLPDLATQPLQPRFAAFPWQPNPAYLKAWQHGKTGIPLVDAGMRQLWQTGWMHNRVRMITASFLVKNLLQPWQQGEAWFWDCLVDADAASNAASWQWVAGCGADAAPYFRIFNPLLQAAKFDPHGDYVRHYLPELAHLPGSTIHAPWQAGSVAGYPPPIVDLAASRAAALAAFAMLKG